jgi:hypothetical protein
MNGVDIIAAGERVIRKATEEMEVKDGWVYFGPLGRVKVVELQRAGIPVGLYPASRRFTDFRLLLMRSSVITIIRESLNIERLIKEKRNEIPTGIYRELLLAADKIRFLGLTLLKDIDERLFNIRYALYDVL